MSIFLKIIDLSIEYVAHSHVRSLLMGVKSEWHIHEAMPYFQKQCERSGTYAALCDCTFEEGPALREVPSKYNKITITLQNAAPLELQSPLVTFVFFSRYLLPMSNKFTTFVPEIK